MDVQEYFLLNQNIIVAFSGGVDSAVLLYLAKKYAKNVIAVFVKSEFQPQFELVDAYNICSQFGIELKVLTVDMLSNNQIISNPKDRCYYCKHTIMNCILDFAKNYDNYVIAEGTNASDDVSDRPGYKALIQLGVQSPLRLLGITKTQIRQIAGENNISVANKPSYACLATRIPTGTKITKEILVKTESSENVLFNLGFTDFRIRYMDGNALLQLSRNDFDVLFEKRETVFAALGKYYNNVYLDLRERTYE